MPAGSPVPLTVAFLLFLAPSFAADAAPPEVEWLRYPAISPDGQQIAFSYAGQIWTVSSDGGAARSLTGGPWHATHPVWSPDGQSIAFAADRHGQNDVFVMPASGGAITRLTYHSANDLPMSFTPDGTDVVFTSARLGDPKADATNAVYGLAGLYERPYRVSATGGRTRPLLPTTAFNIDYGPHGKMLYEDSPAIVENQWRKHHVSDATRDIWRYDPDSGLHEQLTDYRGEDRNPSWSNDGKTAYWLSERGGNFNVWKQELASGAPVQVTHHARWPVRFLSSAKDGTLAYAWDGGLWRLDPDAPEPVRLGVTLGQGSLINTNATRQVTAEVSEVAVAPGGKHIAFIARGEVFVTGWNSKVTRRLTDTTAQERDLAFSSDGRRLAYASERSGDWDIYETVIPDGSGDDFSAPVALEEKLLIDEDADLFRPRYAPDGTHLAYLRNRAELRVHDLEAGTSVQALPGDQTYSYTDGDLNYEWSPDGEWLLIRTGYFSSSEIALVSTDGSVRHNVSRNGFVDLKPTFSQDGTAVLWQSDRYGLRSTEGKPEQVDVIAAYLNRDAWEKAQTTAAERARALTQETAEQTEAENAELVVEPEGFRKRVTRLTPRSGSYILYRLLAGNTSFLSVSVTNTGMVQASAIDLTSGAERQIFNLPGASLLGAESDPEGKALFVLSPGKITRYEVATGQTQAIAYQAEINRSVRDEVDYIIRSNWRATAETFYREDMQGVDWAGVRDHYLRFAPHIFYWEDLAELLGEMDGELNASHQNPSYHEADPLADATGVLGLYYDPDHTGKGMKITDVIAGGPADRKDSPLLPGAVILAVNDTQIGPDIGIDRLLNRMAGQEVRLSVIPSGGGDPVDTIITPISTAQEITLAYQRWVEKRRAIVTELSEGRLGYIHLSAMKTDPYRTAYGDLFGLHQDAEAVVVDIRNNGGGNLHDELVIMLTGSTDAFNRARDGHIVTRLPVGRWTKPSILLQNAGSYSDASVFPMLYQKKSIGRIVGDRTPGTGTAVSDVPQLQTGLRYRVPEMGFQLLDGTWFENTEIVPDVLVHNDPNLIAEGRDPQLEASVKTLLKQLD